MSIDFNANQYENAYLPHKLQNYQIPKRETKRPVRQLGFTTTIANERGHLLPGQPRCRDSPWGSFVGTWDLPDRMPVPSKIIPTARRDDVVERMCVDKFEKEMIISGKLKRCKVPPPLKVKGDVEATSAATAAGLAMAQDRCRSGAGAPCPATTMDASTNAERVASQHWHQPPSLAMAPPPMAATPPMVITPKPATPKIVAATPPAGLVTPKPGADMEPTLDPRGVDWPMPKSVTPHMA